MKMLRLTFLLLAIPAFGQIYSGSPAIYPTGQPLANTPIAICSSDPGRTTPPCLGSLAQTYMDETFTTACTLLPTPGAPLGPISGLNCTNPGISTEIGNWSVFLNVSSNYFAQFYPTGISPTVVPFTINSATNPVFTGTVTFPITGLTQCLRVLPSGQVQGTGVDCGAGGGGGGSPQVVITTGLTPLTVLSPDLGTNIAFNMTSGNTPGISSSTNFINFANLIISDLAGTGSSCLHADSLGNVSRTGTDCATTTEVTSFSGDGTLINNSGATGAVSVTLGTAGAHKYWGNNTGSTGAPNYFSIVAADIPTLNQNTTGNAATATNISTNGTANQVWGMNGAGSAQGWQSSGTGNTTSTSLVSGNLPVANGANSIVDSGIASTTGSGQAILAVGSAAATNQGVLQLNGSTSGNFTISPSSTSSTATLGGSGYATLIVPNGSAGAVSIGSASNTGIYGLNGAFNYSSGGILAFSANTNNVICQGTACKWNGNAFANAGSFYSGTDAATGGNTGGAAVFRSGAITGGTTTNSATGSVTVQSGDNAATGGASQTVGNVTVTAGGFTGASGAATGWTPGYTIVGQKYWADTTTTAGTLACVTTPGSNGQMPKVGTCTATTNIPWIGIISSTVGQSVFVVNSGHVSGVLSNANVTDTAGFFVCLDTTNAGDVVVQSTACAAGQSVGVIDQTGPATTSHSVSITSLPEESTVGAGVSSFTGDGAFATNSASTGAVTLTLASPAGHKYWGNNSAGSTPAAYVSISSGDLPSTIAASTSGSAASLSISGQTGLMTVTGLTSTNRAKTVRDAADTILEQAGSYTPTGTWTWTSCSSCVWPTFNQNTTGTAANITATSNGTLTTLTNGSLTLGANGGSGGVLQLDGATSGNVTETASATSTTLTLGGTGYTTLIVPNGSASAVSIGSAANTGIYGLNGSFNYASGGSAAFQANTSLVECFTSATCIFRADAFTHAATYQSGVDAATAGTTSGAAIFKSAGITSGTTTASATGNATFQSGDNLATGGAVQTVGNAIFTAGGFTGASGAATAWVPGYTEVHQKYWADTTTTAGTLACYTTPGTNGQMPKVGTCTVTSNIPWIGIIVSTTGQSVEVAKSGHAGSVVSNASSTDTAGFFVCTDASNAGKVVVQSTICTAGQGVGIIDLTGSGGTSHNVDVERF